MPHGSYSLGETAAKQKMVRLVCDKCVRRGQYRIDGLLERYGPDIAMPDLRHELAQCPRRRDISTLIDWRIFCEALDGGPAPCQELKRELQAVLERQNTPAGGVAMSRRRTSGN